MHYKVTGKGKAVVLIHGFVEEGSMWNDTAKALARTYKVIVPDLPGFGKSPLETTELSMAYYAEEVYRLLKKEKVNKCIMLGHSMGGYVVLNFAEKYPAMLSGFGLVNSHCFADTLEKKVNRQKGIDFIARNGSKQFVKELYYSIFHETFLKKNKTLVNGLVAKAQQYTPQALMAATAAMMNRQGKEEVLKNATVPVLFISGKQDPSAPLPQVLQQAPYPAIAHLHLFDKCGHMCVFERKKETIAAIKAFCAQ